jgi:ketosteroid isomerase-like protein
MRTWILLLPVGALLAGCGGSVNVTKEREALLNLDREWASHTADVDKYVSYYAPDASMYAPGMAMITGTGPIRETYAKLAAAPGMSLRVDPAKADVSASGDLGYTSGTYQLSMGGGTEKGKYVTVWVKQAGGGWKVKEDIFNADASDVPASTHVVANSADLKWGPAPDALPKGANLVVVAGDPSKSGPYVLRARMPAGYRIMPHWHPADETVTAVEGTVAVGMGDKWDDSKLEKVAMGGVAVMPANMHHYFTAKTAAIIQVHGMGPFAITYVNAADDPRTKH